MKLIAATASAVLIACPVDALVCGDRPQMVSKLEAKYGEFQQSVGMNTYGNMVEVFANPETGSWTIIITDPTGRTCGASSGGSWERTGNTPPEGDPT